MINTHDKFFQEIIMRDIDYLKRAVAFMNGLKIGYIANTDGYEKSQRLKGIDDAINDIECVLSGLYGRRNTCIDCQGNGFIIENTNKDTIK